MEESSAFYYCLFTDGQRDLGFLTLCVGSITKNELIILHAMCTVCTVYEIKVIKF